MRKRLCLLVLSVVFVLCSSTTAFASLSNVDNNDHRLPAHPYSGQLKSMVNPNFNPSSATFDGGGLSRDTSSLADEGDGTNNYIRYKITLGSDGEKDVNVTAVYPRYLHFDDQDWTVTLHISKVYGASGVHTIGLLPEKPGYAINWGVGEKTRFNMQSQITITNTDTGATMPLGLYRAIMGMSDVDKEEVYRFYDTNISNYYTTPGTVTRNGGIGIWYGINDTSLDFSGTDTDDLPNNAAGEADRGFQRFYWLTGDRASISLRYGTAGEHRYASGLSFLAEETYAVRYHTDNGGQSLSLTNERVYPNAHPSGSVLVTKPEWKFVNWTVRQAVTVGSKSIPAGGVITMDEIRQIAVTKDLDFDAHHVPRPQIEVKKLADKQYYQVEDTVTYKIPVWNARPTVEGIATKETNLVISDTLPSDLEIETVAVDYVGDTSGATNPEPIVRVNNSNNSFTVTFPVFTKETPTIVVKAKFKEDVRYTKDITNTVTMKGDDSQYPTGQDKSDDSVTITQVAPKLSIEKKIDKQVYHIGETVHYTVIAKNEIANSWADSVLIDDSSLSLGQNIVAGSVRSSKGTVSQNGKAWSVKIDQLKGGETVTITFDVTLDNKSMNNDVLSNKATLASDQTGGGLESETTATVDADVEYQWNGPHPNKTVPNGGTYDWGITYQTDTSYKPGDKVKDVVDGHKGSWVFKGWDHPASFRLIEDTVIKGEWEFVKEYDITTSIVHGRITPTEIDIPEGSNRVITYTPDLNYQVKSVTVDGESKNIKEYPASYPFEDIKANHDVKVVCELIPGLDIVKTADKDIYNAGDTVTYTVTVSQTVKGAEARDVVITDTMPEGVTLNKDSIKGDVTVVSTEDHSYKVSIASLKDEPVTYTYTGVTAEASDNEELINVVKATGSNVPTDAQDDENVKSLTPKPEITKIVSNETPVYGEEIIYYVTVKEPQDGIVVRNAVITDPIPEGLEYVADSITYDGNLAEAKVEDNKIVVNIPVLEDEVAISFKAKVTAVTGSVDNIATLSGDKIEDIQDNAVINIVEPEPTLTKAVSPSSGSLGDTVTYTVEAASNLPLVDAVIKDTVPEGLALVADSVKCSDETAEVKIEGNAIEVKTKSLSEAVTITYDAILQKEGTFKNIATLEAMNFPKGPLSAEADVEIYPPEPVIEKSVTPETVNAGDEVTYTIKAYSKKGNVHNAVIKDTLPEGLRYVRGSMTIEGDQARASVENNDITVSIAKLNKGVTITFKAKVNATTGTLDNIAVLSGDNMKDIQDNAVLTIAEPNPKLVKKASVTEGSIGDTVTYTINASSDVALKDAVIKDTVPNGLRLVESSVKCSDASASLEVSKDTITMKTASLKDAVTITYEAVIEAEGAHKNVVTLEAANFPKGPIFADATVTGQNVTPVIKKSVDKENGKIGDTVTYTITANAEQGVIRNAVITDKLPDGIKVDKKTVATSGNQEVSVDDDSIVVKCEELGTDPITITYSAELTKSGDQKNVVTLTGDNVKDPVEADATVKVEKEKEQATSGNPTKADGTPDRPIYKTGDFLPYILGALLLAIIAAIAVVLRKRSKDGDDGTDE